MSFGSVLNATMRAANVPQDYLRPTKRPKFFDFANNVQMPSRSDFEQIQNSGGQASLHSNETVTLRYILKPQEQKRKWVQGTLIFYGKTEQQYLSFHEVNDRLKNDTRPVGDDGNQWWNVLNNYRFIGVFRNEMPGNKQNLNSRQALVGIDTRGRSNILDIFGTTTLQTCDTLHLFLVALLNNNPANTTDRLIWAFIPAINMGLKRGIKVNPVSKTPDYYIGEQEMFGACQASLTRYAILPPYGAHINIGTVLHAPKIPNRRNRDTAWLHETQTNGMNHVELILA
ncbi:hypothetical protein OAU26_03755 [Mariniblastus sp.]|nr:hypothetical protein [Mariniblastus sp.]